MPGLLRLGEMGAIAVHLLVDLAGRERSHPGGRRSARELADALGASVHTLQKVARRLAVAGWIDGARGAGGGFRLAADPADISLLDVIRAMDGPTAGHGCLFERRVCPPGARCAFSGLTGSLERQVRDYLRRATLAALLAGETGDDA